MRIDLHKKSMYLIPQAACVHDGVLSFSREQVEDHRIVLGVHSRQVRRLLTHEESYRAGVELVRLAGLARTTSSKRRQRGLIS